VQTFEREALLHRKEAGTRADQQKIWAENGERFYRL